MDLGKFYKPILPDKDMKKGVVLMLGVILLLSFFVLAESDNSNSNDSGVSVNSETDVSANLNGSANMTKAQIEEQKRIQEQNAEQIKNQAEQQKNNQEREAERMKEAIQEKNRLRFEDGNGTCPAQCECSPEERTVKCEFENGTRELTIHAGNSNNTIIQVKNINASTQVTLYKEGDKIYGQFRNNETRMIILPDEIRDRIMNQTRARLQNETYNLTQDGEYQIEARKRARLFWIVPVKERTQIRVDAETGNITDTSNSWWGFLARDVRVEANASSSSQ